MRKPQPRGYEEGSADHGQGVGAADEGSQDNAAGARRIVFRQRFLDHIAFGHDDFPSILLPFSKVHGFTHLVHSNFTIFAQNVSKKECFRMSIICPCNLRFIIFLL